MRELITRVYNYSEHKGSTEIGAVSATTLIGSLYKAKLAMKQTPRDSSLVPEMYKRSSTLGSAFHAWCEKALSDDENIIQEVYNERKIGKYLITGSCDLIVKQPDGRYKLGDWKTGYGKNRSAENLEKDIKQQSIYRWLNQDDYEFIDEASSLFVSQSNNVQEEYLLQLMSLEEAEEYIENRLYAIEQNETVDCNFMVKYNACTYCDFVCEHRRKK